MTRPLPLAALALASIATVAAAQDKPAGADFAAYSAHAMQKIMAADTDHDGKISKDEFMAAMKGRAPKHMLSHSFEHADANHDGVLDQNEIKALIAHRFAKADANHDGVVTPDERQTTRDGAPDPQE